MFVCVCVGVCVCSCVNMRTQLGNTLQVNRDVMIDKAIRIS